MEGQHVKKDDEISMLHHGGSSHCVLFQKSLDLIEFPSFNLEQNVPVRSKIGD